MNQSKEESSFVARGVKLILFLAAWWISFLHRKAVEKEEPIPRILYMW